MPWELTGNTNTNENINFLGTTDQHALVVKTKGKEALRIDPNGNVGIGTTNPVSKLEIVAQDALQIVGFQPFVTLTDSENNLNARARIQNARGDINFFTEASFSTGIPPVKIQNAGTVQIFTQDALQIVGFQPFVTLTDSENNLNARARIQNARGDINFFTESSLSTGIPPMKIQNGSGDVAISGNLTVGRDIFLPGADCAEHFDIGGAEQIEPGTVVVIDREGTLRRSEQAYDKKVAGVVSGAGEYRPGIVLDRRQSQDGRAPVSLVGKVYCKVDAKYASIEVGDLLTSSPTPGHAMKASDPFQAFGAVIGKALRPWHDGCGLIPILICLQ
jgi:hypothetical protein